MTRNVIACGLLSCLSLLLTTVVTQEAAAQDTVLTELYGRGVHAYFRGDFPEAQKLLDTVVDQGTSDPRVYYFLGLADHQMGEEDKAKANFTKGAELELDQSQVYPVSKALERVQGSERLLLEEYREKVRTAVYLQKKKEEKALFEARKMAEEDVLRSRAKRASAGVNVDVPSSDETDPFGSPGAAALPEMPAPVEATETETAPAASGANPFGSPMPEVTETPAGDPFGGAPSTSEDPFGGSPMPGVTNPSEDPFGGSPTTPGAGDPFGAAPVNPPAPTTIPAAPANDPFGAPPGGATPAEQDAVLPPDAAEAMGGGSPNPVTEAISAIGGALIPSVKVPSVPGVTGPAGGPAMPASDGFPPAGEMPMSDPFGGSAPPSGNTPAPSNDPFGGPMPQPMGDPFGASAPPASAPGNDPFGEEKPVPKPAGGDPFGGSAPPSDDPFGAPPASTEDEPVMPLQPMGETPSNDPFGAAPSSSEDEPVMPLTPMGEAPANDPFGAAPASSEEEPVMPLPENDPFGDN
ncbi:hypothetical protein DTL21_20035 [Bremerella cremea]|uniref:Uncharacterized protein n=1 Tax=Blastopirellula marina TaxID=124 RepID=A0A2S8FK10_9BACT|nr:MULTISPECIES: hypothetical protein [Pirellulaceae]PQO32502.1 hypothetical protein C5Y83_20015 [Blastopirellula marina]RCS45569.1 hypothetical protein DTL21_20035 [Bremerella cremea]